jgi:hypothetical protein
MLSVFLGVGADTGACGLVGIKVKDFARPRLQLLGVCSMLSVFLGVGADTGACGLVGIKVKDFARPRLRLLSL